MLPKLLPRGATSPEDAGDMRPLASTPPPLHAAPMPPVPAVDAVPSVLAVPPTSALPPPPQRAL